MASPWLSELWVVVAFFVDFAATSATIIDASGPEDAPEFVTAWHPPVVPSHDPVPCDSRASGETDGSVPVAALLTDPVHALAPSQDNAAPEADAADGPGVTAPTRLAGFSPASSRAAPGPVEATDVLAALHAPVPAVQDAEPVELRGAPTAASELDADVVTVPVQPCGQSSAALERDMLDGPLTG